MAVDGSDVLEEPVLHFKNDHSAPGMENDKIGMEAFRPDWNVIPATVVVFQFGFQLLREAPFPRSSGFAGGYGRDEGGHGVSLHFWIVEMRPFVASSVVMGGNLAQSTFCRNVTPELWDNGPVFWD